MYNPHLNLQCQAAMSASQIDFLNQSLSFSSLKVKLTCGPSIKDVYAEVEQAFSLLVLSMFFFCFFDSFQEYNIKNYSSYVQGQVCLG